MASGDDEELAAFLARISEAPPPLAAADGEAIAPLAAVEGEEPLTAAEGELSPVETAMKFLSHPSTNRSPMRRCARFCSAKVW